MRVVPGTAIVDVLNVIVLLVVGGGVNTEVLDVMPGAVTPGTGGGTNVDPTRRKGHM